MRVVLDEPPETGEGLTLDLWRRQRLSEWWLGSFESFRITKKHIPMRFLEERTSR